MVVCKVVGPVLGWNIGDQIEASGERLNELIADGSVEVLVSDEKPQEEIKAEVKEVKKYVGKGKKVSK